MNKNEFFFNEKKKIKKSKKKKNEQKEKIKEEILLLGLAEHNQYLMHNGFTKYKRNLKFLRMYNFNKEEALNALIMRRIQKLELKEKNIIIKFNLKKMNVCKIKFWSPNLKSLYIDGNNILFCEENLRKMSLIDSNLYKYGQILLSMLVLEYARINKIQHTFLLFDKTMIRLNLNFIFLNEDFDNNIKNFQDFVERNCFSLTENFEQNRIINEDFKTKINFLAENIKILKYNIEGVNILSSRPDYETSDDALVEIIQKVEKASSVFVTSDNELQRRLHENGLIYYSTNKSFMKIMIKSIGEEKYNKYVSSIRI